MPKQRERRKAGKYPSPARRRRWLLGGLASAIALATAGTLFWLDQQAPAPSIAVQLPPPAPAGLLASQETSGPEVVVDDARPGGRVADKSAPPAPGPDARKPPPPQPEAEPAPVAARIPATVRRNEQIIITVHPATAAGYAAMADGNLDSAREHYQQALRGDQRNRDALLGLAVAALREGRSEEAVRRYEQVLALDPRDPDANAGIALQRGAMDPVAYESRLRALLAERGDNAALHHAFGSLLARQNRWGEAQEALFRAVTLAPSSADYQFNLAVSLDHLGQYAQARTYYRKALEQGKAGSIAFSRDAVQARIAAIEALAP